MKHAASLPPTNVMRLIAAAILLAACNPASTLAQSAPEPKYAPDRKIDLLHQSLDITPDFDKRTIRGESALTFKPIAQPLDELTLDAVDLNVESVECTEKLASHHADDRRIIVTFAQPIPAGHETTLTIRYWAKPAKGLFFRVPSNGYPAQDTHLWTQGEPSDARHWFPCIDHPNLKFASQITCRVPKGMTVLSNGRQVSADVDPATGLVAVRWVQDKPLANYLITLVAGYFTKIEDKHRAIPLLFYTLPSDANEAPLTFQCTKPAMAFLEQEIAVPYPWPQYGQVVVRDFTAGGMENTSFTTLTDRTLHRPDIEEITTSETLVAHELAHQWFGDLVTCKDWSQAWLNEGFATYYTHLFFNQQHGRDEFLYGMQRDASIVTQQSNKNERPIVFRQYEHAWEQFDYRSYPKGSWVIHMLREQLGPDLFRQCVKTYLQRHAYGCVTTADLLSIIEELSGQSFERFFDQWVYHAGQPELDVTYAWDQKAKLAKLTIRQTQAGDQVMLFHFPLKIRFKVQDGPPVEQTLQVQKKDEDFYIPLPREPRIVRIDPDLQVLAKINFRPSRPMLLAQLADATDMLGRLLAVEQLAGSDDSEVIATLKTALNNDPFYGVRIKITETLRQIHSDEAMEALLDSTRQSDPRARKAVIDAIAQFFHPRVADALLHTLETERNPYVLASAMRGLSPYHRPEVKQALLRYLASDSHRQMLADTAIATMRAQDLPAYIAPLSATLIEREQSFTSAGFAAALETLGFLARNEKMRDEVRDFLASFLNHKRDLVQVGAMQALAALEDPKSIPILSTFASASKDTPQQRAAEKAIAALRSVNKPSDNLKDLRQDMLDLQKETQRLQKELEDLKKRTSATNTH